MPIRPRNQDRPITPAVVADVKRFAKLKYTAQQIANQIGRSKISVYNITRLYNISLGYKKRP
jgi:hypothetical protein